MQLYNLKCWQAPLSQLLEFLTSSFYPGAITQCSAQFPLGVVRRFSAAAAPLHVVAYPSAAPFQNGCNTLNHKTSGRLHQHNSGMMSFQNRYLRLFQQGRATRFLTCFWSPHLMGTTAPDAVTVAKRSTLSSAKSHFSSKVHLCCYTV